MAQIDDDKIVFLATVELTKKGGLQNCIEFLSAIKTLCYQHNIDVRQPTTGAILWTEDKEGKTEYRKDSKNDKEKSEND